MRGSAREVLGSFRWDERGPHQSVGTEFGEPLGIRYVFSELDSGLGLWLLVRAWIAGWAVLVRPAASVKVGMPSWTVWLRLVVIWASLARAPARLTLSPSASPSHRCSSASAMRVMRLSRIWTRRGRAAGSGRSSGHRRQLYSWMQGVS